MNKRGHIYSFAIVICIVTLLTGACSSEDTIIPEENTISLRINIDDNIVLTRTPSETGAAVNRILILPFQKTDESLTNDDGNFAPVYAKAKQLNVTSFPTVATMLDLPAASTYKIMIIGYNQNDYDFTNQSSGTRTFNIGSSATTATLTNLYLQPLNPTIVPEFFSCIGNGYMGNTLVGTYFKPGQINNISAELRRIVCGLSLNITNIPAYVKSISLSAQQLVTATRATDGLPLTWQTAGDSGLKSFGEKAPVSGQISFNNFLLATNDVHKTQLYLDVKYSTFTERYIVKLADANGTVASNAISFLPNHWVKISGDYSKINFGFILTANINLDDNVWDGIQ